MPGVMKAKISGEHVNFSMRRLQRDVKLQLMSVAIALGVSQEEVANSAMKIGLRVLQRKIVEGEIE